MKFYAPNNMKFAGKWFDAGEELKDENGNVLSKEEGERLISEGRAVKRIDEADIEKAEKLASVKQALQDRASQITSELKSLGVTKAAKQKKLSDGGLDKKDAAELESEVSKLQDQHIELKAAQGEVKSILGML